MRKKGNFTKRGKGQREMRRHPRETVHASNVADRQTDRQTRTSSRPAGRGSGLLAKRRMRKERGGHPNENAVG